MKIKKILLTAIFVCAALITSGCYEEEAAPRIISSNDYTSSSHQYSHTAPIAQTQKRQYTNPYKSLKGKTIIVDPGHGGKDPGALARWGGKNEKVIVLDVAQKLAAELESKGARVIMTRKNDRFIELNNRAKAATAYNADLLISIHADAHDNPNINGATCYISKRALAKSRQIAESIESSFDLANISNKGVRKADFRVLVKHSKPAVLVECGYLTNRNDSNRLNSSRNRKRIAEVIAKGVANALK